MPDGSNFEGPPKIITPDIPKPVVEANNNLIQEPSVSRAPADLADQAAEEEVFRNEHAEALKQQLDAMMGKPQESQSSPTLETQQMNISKPSIVSRVLNTLLNLFHSLTGGFFRGRGPTPHTSAT